MIRVGQKYQHLIHGAGCACTTPALVEASRRLDAFTRRGLLGTVLALAGAAATPALAQTPPAKILFRQARLFDGKSNSLQSNVQVLVEGNRIAPVDTGNAPPPVDATIIDCGGRMLMPGLIDAHWHTLFCAVPVTALLSGDPATMFTSSTAEANRTLQRGFTTVRDLGGPVFSFKQAIDTGVIPGPRIFPSGAMITTTGGHADLRMPRDVPRDPARLSMFETISGAITDSVGELGMRVRERLFQGASQIKLVGGGGVSSPRSPLDMTTFSEDDLKAAVAIARDWNTYVAPRLRARSHPARHFRGRRLHRARPPDRRAERAAHGREGDLAQHATLPERGRFGSPDRAEPRADAPGLRQHAAALWAHPQARHQDGLGIRPAVLARDDAAQGVMLTHLSQWYSNAEALRMATSGNAELLTLSGPRTPYAGKLGVVEPGALADLLVVNGNLLDDIKLIEQPDRNLASS